MPNANAVVSRVLRFLPALDRPTAELMRAPGGLQVELEEGRRARLDPANPRSVGWAQVLEGLRKLGLPAYLELEPATSAITRLLIADVTRVVAVAPIDEQTLGVQLERSHAVHALPRKDPDFAELEKRLREAMQARRLVVVTEDDAHAIIDVRPPTPGQEGPARPFPEWQPPRPLEPRPKPPWDFLVKLWYWPCWPWWWLWCISMTRAQQVFDAMNATSCDPLAVPPPCIPFLYPDDGCWGRAHAMRRLMVPMGLSPKKVWIQGSLYVNTKNNPNCHVSWGWHVAPTLCVRIRCWYFWFRCQTMVIDPSLFGTPVTEATWKSVQGDPNASLTDTAGDIFLLWGMVTDPTYAQTDVVLATYRLKLQLRAVNVGPPPYAYCP